MTAPATLPSWRRRVVETHLVLLMLLPMGVILAAEALPNFDQLMAAIQRTESGGNPYAILDNSTIPKRSYQLKSRDEAIGTARQLLAAGHNIDMGLMQLNSRYHLSGVGGLEAMFDPSRNLAYARNFFRGLYDRAIQRAGQTMTAITQAISAYNAGEGRAARGQISNWPYFKTVLRFVGLSDTAAYAGSPETTQQKQANPYAVAGATSDENTEYDGAPDTESAAVKPDGRKWYQRLIPETVLKLAVVVFLLIVLAIAVLIGLKVGLMVIGKYLLRKAGKAMAKTVLQASKRFLGSLQQQLGK